MNPAVELTERQRAVLAVIERSIRQHGYPPTRAEIALAMGFRSANAAQEHLQVLARKGYITIEGSHRGIKLVKRAQRGLAARELAAALASATHPSRTDEAADGDAAAHASAGSGDGLVARSASSPLADSVSSLRLPLVGRVAAGQPILAEQHVETHFTVDPALFQPRPDFLLRVSGLSMRDAGILDGDLVAVKSAREARNGQIVVARLGEEATVKTLERRGERVRLLPANPDFEPIEIDRREPLVIEGLVVGVLRRSLSTRAAPGAGSSGAAKSAKSARTPGASANPAATSQDAVRGALGSDADRR